MTNSPYQVNYGRPPRHTQFQKGQSGNPGGRPGPKKVLKRDFDRALCKALDADEKTFRAARPVRMVEIAARRTVIHALDGKLPALKLILSVLEKGDCDLTAEESGDERGEGGFDSLSQGKSQAIQEKAGAADNKKDEAFERLYEAARAAGRLDQLFDPSLDDSDEAFEMRFNAACDAGLFDDFLALYDAPENSLSQGNPQGLPQNNGRAGDVMAR